MGLANGRCSWRRRRRTRRTRRTCVTNPGAVALPACGAPRHGGAAGAAGAATPALRGVVVADALSPRRGCFVAITHAATGGGSPLVTRVSRQYVTARGGWSALRSPDAGDAGTVTRFWLQVVTDVEWSTVSAGAKCSARAKAFRGANDQWVARTSCGWDGKHCSSSPCRGTPWGA